MKSLNIFLFGLIRAEIDSTLLLFDSTSNFVPINASTVGVGDRINSRISDDDVIQQSVESEMLSILISCGQQNTPPDTCATKIKRKVESMFLKTSFSCSVGSQSFDWAAYSAYFAFTEEYVHRNHVG